MTTAAEARPAPVPESPDPDTRARVAGLAFWVVLPLLALAVVIAASATFATRVNAQPVGVRGTFVADLRSCTGNVCQVAGTFTSDDGRLVVRNVLGDYRLRTGQRRSVVLNPQAEIISLPARWNPTATVAGLVGGLVVLGGWAWFAVGAARARRRGIPAPIRPDR